MNNIEFLALLPVVLSHQDQGEYLYTPEAYAHHWIPLGHKVTAEAIFTLMKEFGWADSAEDRSGILSFHPRDYPVEFILKKRRIKLTPSPDMDAVTLNHTVYVSPVKHKASGNG